MDDTARNDTAAAPPSDPPTSRAVGEHDAVQLLQAVAIAANEARSVDEAIRTCLAEVCVHTGWPVGHAYLLSAEGVLEPTGIWHLADEERFREFRNATEGTSFRVGEGIPGRVLETGEPIWVADLSREPRFLRAPAAAAVGAACFFPILVGRDVVGVMEFFCGEPAEPSSDFLRTMLPVGVQLGHVVDRARAEDQRRLSEAKFAGIFNISTDAIVSVDESQRITYFNQGAENVFGYSADELMGERLEVLIPPRFRAAHEDQVRSFGEGPVAARRMGERGQITGLRKDGDVFPADASISRIQVDGKRIYTAVLRDITERKRAEEALAQQAAELARSNAELEQFAYVASHDLQEPLRMIASYTQLLARRYRGKLDTDAEEFIGYAVEGVTRMQALINDLLTYSRVGTRGAEYSLVDAGAVLDRVLVSLGPTIEENDATVTHDELPTLCADAGQLGQLFQNLAANAVKFRGSEPPRVHVAARRGEGEWVFSVSDNGIGIAPEFRERIFVIFQRLHNRSEYAGTGIGLSICKKIVERHGGRIWLDSEPGQGTTFHFTFPDRDCT
jgi:PAS domain S-box-containing protein